MSSNISGFQGVNTPLQSMTNGKYTLADYTKMNTLFGARITALEKAVAFNPNNVTISGYVNVQPNASNAGTLTTAGAAQIGGNLQVNKTLNVVENAFIGGSLQVSGPLSFASLAVNTFTSNTINNSGLTISNSFSGNGAALTGVTGTDSTKLPLTGGSLSGVLAMGANAITSTGTISAASFSGNGAALTGVTATDSTKLPLTGGSLSGVLAMGANAITSTGSISAATFSGNGAAVTGVIAAGLTGSILFSAPSCAQNYKQNQFANWNSASYTPFQLNPSVHDCFRYTGTTATNLLLTNNGVDVTAFYQDGMRLITVLRPMNGVGAYAINIFPPTGYLIYYPGIDAAANYLMNAPESSVTFMVISAAKIGAANGQMHLISKT